MKVLILILSSMLLATLGACGGEDGGDASCKAYCDNLFSCEVDTVPGCFEDCTQVVGEISGACLSAFTNVNICVAGLSCEQAQAWWDQTPPGSYPCKAQDDAEIRACD